MTLPHTQSIQVRGGNTVFITAGESQVSLALYGRNLSSSIQMTTSDARALAERIINTLDNFQLTKNKEQDHAESGN